MPGPPVNGEAGVPRGFQGTNLTLFIGLRGRAIGLAGRPGFKPKTEQLAGFHGRDLSHHRGMKGKAASIYLETLALHRARVGFWGALWAALKWLFTIRFKLLTIERYVWGEVWNFFLVGATAFTFFMIATTIFTYGEKIFSKNIPPFTIAKMLLLTAPQFLVLAVPVAVLFSTLMAMNRFNRDNEITAMITNGVSLYRVFIPFISLAIFAGLLTWSITEYVAPPNVKDQRETLKVFWEAQVVDFIKPGIVISAPERKFFYVDSINKTEGIMNGVRLYDYMDDNKGQRRFPRVFLAKHAWVENSQLVLSDVTVFELDKSEGNTLVQARMPKVMIDIATKLSEYTLTQDPNELSSSDLRTKIRRDTDRIASLKFSQPVDLRLHNTDIVVYYLKFAVPVACLAFVLVAVPISLRGPRDERNLGLILSFALVMAYYVVLFTCREVGSRGLYATHPVNFFGLLTVKPGTNMLPGIIAAWIPPALFVFASGFLIARARR